MGVQAIADKLTAEGVPSCADSREWRAKKDATKALGEDWTPKKRASGQWAPGMIYPILKRETYTGVWFANHYQMKVKRRPTSEKAKKRTVRGIGPIGTAYQYPPLLPGPFGKKHSADSKTAGRVRTDGPKRPGMSFYWQAV